MDQLISQLESYAKGIWKYRWAAMITAWIAVLAGGAVVYLLPDKYQASARVFVDTQNILKPLLSSMTTVPNMEQQVVIMSRTLLSRPNVEKVIRMADLDLETRTDREHEELVEKLIKSIRVAATGHNDIYTISYNNENPVVAKNVVQSLLTVFVESSLGDKKQESDKAIAFLDDQIKSYEKRLAAAEDALKDFKLKNAELLPRRGQSGVYESRLSELSELLGKARLDLEEAEQSRDAIKKQIAGEEPILFVEQAPSAPGNSQIDTRIQALKKNLDALQLQYTAQHPDIVSTKRLIEQLEALRAEEARKQPQQPASRSANYSPMLQELNIALSDAEATVAARKARVRQYAARVGRLKSMNDAVPELERQFSQLNRDYDINKANYERLIERREAAKLSVHLSATSDLIRFRVIDPPMVPLVPAGPNRPLLFSAAFIGALLAGAAMAFLLSQMRPTFLNSSSLRELTGLPVLGTVSMTWTPQERKRRRRSLYSFGLASLFLLLVFGGGLGTMMFDYRLESIRKLVMANLG